MTLDAAYALGDEARRGHLAPGTLGDVTILSGDVTGAYPDEIRAMTVIATIVGGDIAFCGDGPSARRWLTRHAIDIPASTFVDGRGQALPRP